MSEISFDEIQQLFSKDLDIKPGGHWKPKDCKPRWKVRCYFSVLVFFFSCWCIIVYHCKHSVFYCYIFYIIC